MMTWQVALGILAALIFIAVIAYNAWVLRKNTPPQPLRAARKNEPGLEAGAEAKAGETGASVAEPPAVAPLLPDDEDQGTGASIDTEAFIDIEAETAAVGAIFDTGPRHNDWKIDERLDAVVTMVLPQATVSEKILAHAPDTSRRVGTKPQILEALNMHTDIWEYPQPGQQYSQVRMAVQMLNRHGAITDLEYSEFASSAQAFGDKLDVLVDLPDMRNVVHAAREMDAISGKYDVQLKMHIVPGAVSWTAGYVEEQAAEVGFAKTNVPGSMLLVSDGKPAETVLRLEFDTAAAVAEEEDEGGDDARTVIEDVELCLDVACVRQELRPYDALCQAAEILAQRLQGNITDAQGESLDAEQVETIGRELRDRYRELSQAGLTAGSPLCLRMYAS